MKNTFTKILLCAFALLIGSTAFAANSDVITSVTCSGTTFTIKRTTTTSPTRVYYRTCNGSAIAGVHFQGVCNYIDFATGESSKTVEITKLNPAATVIDAYDESTKRYFFLEVWNSCTTPKFTRAEIASNISVSKSYIYDASVEKGDGIAHKVPLWKETFEQTWDLSSFESQFESKRKNYLNAVGQSYRYAVRCRGIFYKGKNGSTTPTAPDQTDMRIFSYPNDERVFSGRFKMITPLNLNNSREFWFPIDGVDDNMSTSADPIINPWNHAYNDVLHYHTVYTTSRIINSKKWALVPENATSIELQVYNHSVGPDGCDAYLKSYVELCLCDTKSPNLKSISVNTDKTYTSGETIYVALRFDEIVKVTNSSLKLSFKIGTEYFDFSYVDGSGTNILYFSAAPEITSTTSVSYIQTNVTGYPMTSITDMSGNYTYITSASCNIKVGQKYTVSYELNGGTINCNEIKYYTYGVIETLPSNVTRTGYTFDGWYTNSSFTGSKVTSISPTATGNKTYYAKWTANQYLVTFDNLSATNPGTPSIYATYDKTMPAITPPTKTGYTFGGYFTSTSGGTQYYYASGTGYRTCYLSGPITLYARWTVKTPSVTLDQQGATTYGTTSTTATYASAMPELTSVPVKTGYTFGGYYSGQNGTGVQYYKADGTSAKNCDFETATTLYAKWTVNQYTVTLNNQNATTQGTASVTATYGQAMPNIIKPARTGYTFNGYYTYTNGSGTRYYYADGSSARNYTLTSNTTLYAYWTKDTYTITYNNNGGTINGSYSATYQYGDEVDLPEDVTHVGCSFGGWYNNANCEGAEITSISSTSTGDKTFYAKWTPNEYTVTLNPGEGSISNGDIHSYIYGVGAILPTASSMSLQGKTFAGWYDNPEFEGDAISEITVADYGNKTFYALWDANVYPVVLNTNEGVIRAGNVVSYKNGIETPLPTNVIRTGYIFEGWYENSSCLGSSVSVIPASSNGAKTYWAKWREDVYDITYEPNEGVINDEVIPTQYTFSVGASLPANVTREGYAFAGWFDNSLFEGQPIALVRSSDYGNKTYYAKWNIKTYTITFNNNGGDVQDEEIPSSYQFGDEVALPTEVYKEGYEFLGWYDNSNFYNEPVSVIENGDFGNKTFYAKWLVQNYTINYNANGGTINSGNVTNYTYGHSVMLPTDVTRNGYRFDGWYSDEALTSKRIDFVSNTDMGNKMFYAKWINNIYIVTFYPNEGVISSDNVDYSYVFGNETVLPTEVERNGYTFGGWFTSPSFDGSPVLTITENDFGNKTYYAKWTVNTYNVTLNANGGTINSGKLTNYIYGVGAILPTDVTKVGHTFKGWYADEDFSSSEISAIAVNEMGEKEFFAKWMVNSYSVTFNTMGGTINEEPFNIYTFGVGDSLPTDVTRMGYTFEGWYNNSSYAGAAIDSIFPTETGAREYWAKWSVNSYSVEFNTNGGTINNGKVSSYIYGTTILLPIDVTKVGYTFDGWYDNADFEGEPILTISSTDLGDKIFYAKFTVNTYNVILVTNEGVINSGSIEAYEFGTGATLPTDVTKTGYTFDGWYSNSSYIGGPVSSIAGNDMGDKQFWAKWTINEYEVTATAENGTVEGTGSYEYRSTTTLKAVPNDGYEFVGWNDNTLKDARIQFVVTKDTTLVANFKEKEKVQIAGTLEIPTLKTERESAPIDLAGLFTTTEGGEVTYSATSSAPNVVAATVSEGKLFLTVYEYEGEAEITVTATLPNGEKNSVKATANVVLACNIQVEGTITNVSCFGESDGEIALKVTNAAEPYTTKWENETSVEDTIRNIVAGNYSVVITDNENCVYNKTYTVTEPAEMTLKATVKNPTCENADGSISIVLTGAESATFAWSNEATTQNVASLEKGDYSVVITNTETGCQISDSYTLVEPDAPVVTVSNIVSTACNKANGAVTISTNEDGLIYSWSNNNINKNLTNVPAGDYTLNVVNPETNCTASLNVTVPSIQLKQPEIALVTVSQESGKNLVVWLKENTDLIDYYTIYRVDTAKNKYDKVVDVPYGELSVYEDLQANPMERAWKYKMSATDVCGNETAMSDYHSSLHLMKIKSLGVENHLAWDPYEGIDFDSYVILRKTKVKGVVEIDTLATIPSDLTSYTDTLPARGTTSYYVGVKLPEVINPKTQFLKAESGPFVIALSNIAEVENYVAVQNVVKSNAEVYAIGHTIYVKNPDGLETTIYDINGRKLEMSQSFDNSEFTVKLDGVYLVKVGNEMFKVFVK